MGIDFGPIEEDITSATDKSTSGALPGSAEVNTPTDLAPSVLDPTVRRFRPFTMRLGLRWYRKKLCPTGCKSCDYRCLDGESHTGFVSEKSDHNTGVMHPQVGCDLGTMKSQRRRFG